MTPVVLTPTDVPAVLVLSIVLLVVFMLWEYHLENRTTYPPVIKPSIFSRYHYKPLGLVICGFGISVSVQGWSYNTTIWYQNLKGYSALKNAIQLLPANIGGLIAAVRTTYDPSVIALTVVGLSDVYGTQGASPHAVDSRRRSRRVSCKYYRGLTVQCRLHDVRCPAAKHIVLGLRVHRVSFTALRDRLVSH